MVRRTWIVWSGGQSKVFKETGNLLHRLTPVSAAIGPPHNGRGRTIAAPHFEQANIFGLEVLGADRGIKSHFAKVKVIMGCQECAAEVIYSFTIRIGLFQP